MLVDDWPHWDHGEPYGIGCSNEECVAYVGYGTRLFDTEAEAIAAWNRRAVEATLGRGGMEWDGDVLVLTLPRDPSSIHVRRADGGPRKVYPSEATLGRGTCRVESVARNEYGHAPQMSDYTFELSCGHSVTWDEQPDYCPWCGRRVIE